MSHKKLDWAILAQCDYYAVQKYVETSNRPAMKVLEPLRKVQFERNLINGNKWQEAYTLVCNAYQALKPNFEINHDQFGGYRLIYKGQNALKPQTVLKPTPVGFVKAVPDGAVTNLSVMTSERTGEQLLLLGPIRFVNSNCDPNSEYDFSSVSGIVQLRTKKKIQPGEEIFVKYSEDFSEENECKCRVCELKRNDEELSIALEILHTEVLCDLLDEIANLL